MYNLNSPTVNNMFNGGIYPGYIPPNPIGNIVGIGNNGYNPGSVGGYYNGVYNTQYNPYLIKQQEEIRKAQEKEERRLQSDIFKSISKCANSALGIEVDDEYLKRYDYQDEVSNQYVEETEMKINIKKGQEVVKEFNDKTTKQIRQDRYYETAMLDLNAIPHTNRMALAYGNAYVRINENEKKRHPSDMSLFEYLEKAGELYVEALESKEMDKRKDISQLYNRGGYNQLIQMHHNSGNAFGNTFNREVNIDDMEITLPNHLMNEHQIRKQQFLNKIMGNGGV